MASIYFLEDQDGLTIFGLQPQPRKVQKTNPRYSQIVTALREKAFSKIDGLISGFYNATTAQPINPRKYGALNPAMQWPFPVGQPQTAVRKASKAYHKNYKVWIYDNGSIRSLVRVVGQTFFDANDVAVAMAGDKNLHLRAVRTKTIQPLVSRLSPSKRELFIIKQASPKPN